MGAGAGLVGAGAGLVGAGVGLVGAGAGLVGAAAGLVGGAGAEPEGFTSTRVPDTRRIWPSVTTRSPGWRTTRRCALPIWAAGTHTSGGIH